MGMLYVHTPPDLAFKFHVDRGEGPLAIDEFFRRRDDPVEEDVKGLLPMADAVLYNWEGRPMYQKSIHMMMSELRVSQT